jgi:hypothetical protein
MTHKERQGEELIKDYSVNAELNFMAFVIIHLC